MEEEKIEDLSPLSSLSHFCFHSVSLLSFPSRRLAYQQFRCYMLCKHGCKYMFFQSWSYYSKNKASRSPKTWCRTHYHVIIRLPKSASLSIIRTPPISSSKMSKTGKLKIRYISVITQKSVIFKKSKIDFKSTGSVSVSLHPLATITHAYFQFYVLSTKRNQYFTS